MPLSRLLFLIPLGRAAADVFADFWGGSCGAGSRGMPAPQLRQLRQNIIHDFFGGLIQGLC